MLFLFSRGILALHPASTIKLSLNVMMYLDLSGDHYSKRV